MFIKNDFNLLGEIFALARVQSVTTDPKNRQQLENIMNLEAYLASKMLKANDALGFVEEDVKKESEEKKETPLSKVSEETEVPEEIVAED